MNKGNGVVFDSRDQGWRGFDGLAIRNMYVTDGESIVDDEIRSSGAGNGWFCKNVGWHRFRLNCPSRASGLSRLVLGFGGFASGIVYHEPHPTHENEEFFNISQSQVEGLQVGRGFYHGAH